MVNIVRRPSMAKSRSSIRLSGGIDPIITIDDRDLIGHAIMLS